MPSDLLQCADWEPTGEVVDAAAVIQAHEQHISAETVISLPPTPPEIVDWIKEYEGNARELDQLDVKTEHLIHAGMYARTVHLPAMGMFTNVLIKIPTVVIVSGYCYMWAGTKWVKLVGYHAFPASAGRKQICMTKEPTSVTMIFSTDATTVEEAESQFTDEIVDLLSHKQPESNLRVKACLE